MLREHSRDVLQALCAVSTAVEVTGREDRSTKSVAPQLTDQATPRRRRRPPSVARRDARSNCAGRTRRPSLRRAASPKHLQDEIGIFVSWERKDKDGLGGSGGRGDCSFRPRNTAVGPGLGMIPSSTSMYRDVEVVVTEKRDG